MPKTNPSPHIAILMAVKDGAAYLPETIASLQAQTFSNWQALVVDDGSTDETATQLKAIAKADPRITILTNPQAQGLALSLNRALEHAQSLGAPYLARMDADDIALPQRFAVQLAFLEDHPAILGVSCWAQRFGAASSTIAPRLSPTGIQAMLAFNSPLIHPGIMLRATTFTLPGGPTAYPPLPTAQDYGLWTTLAPHATFAIIPQVLLHYRVHAKSITATMAGPRAGIIRTIQANYIARLTGHTPTEAQMALHTAFITRQPLPWRRWPALFGWLTKLVFRWPHPSAMAQVATRQLLGYALARLKGQ